MDTSPVIIELVSNKELKHDLLVAKQEIAVYEMAQDQYLTVWDGENVESRLSELRQIKSKIEDQLRFRNGEL
jgi:hypothetical protein